jgi:pimeloyl-[acyl-carrier protein] methyl ester esterase
VSLHIETLGAGPPLVLLHGWAMHSGLWSGVLRELAERYRLSLVDLPGHGHSRELAAADLDDMVDAVDRHVQGEALHVLGWSMGGTVAMRWAGERPERVARLTLLSTTPRFLVDGDWPWAMAPALLEQFADNLRNNYRHTLQRFLSLQVQGSEEGRQALHALRHQLFARGEPAPAVLAEGLEMLRTTDLRSLVPMLRQPALIIAGDRDTLTPVGASRWLAGALTDSRHVVIEGAAHAPQLSHRARFLAALEEFDGERV